MVVRFVFHGETLNHEPAEQVRCVLRELKAFFRWRNMRTRPNAAKRELFKVCADPVTHAGGYWVSGTL